MFKTKKIIMFLLCISILFSTFLFNVNASAGLRSYYFTGEEYYSNTGYLRIDDYSRDDDLYRYFAKNVTTSEGDYGIETTASWEINGYKSSSTGTTGIYQRFDGMNGVVINSGEKITFTLDFTFWMTENPNTEFTLDILFNIDGWSLAPIVRFGKVVSAKRGQYTFEWTNTDKYGAKIQFFYVRLMTNNPVTIESGTVVETMYGNASFYIGTPNSIADQIANDNKNTQAIIDNEKEMYENEKQEATDSGNDSVDDVMSAIPADNDGFISAIEKLGKVLVTDSTEAKWTFPALYIPAIEGVTSKIELSSEKDIDFGYWIKQIPSTILTLIQYISTIALIIYCFKELYSTIEYILTLRKGGNSE